MGMSEKPAPGAVNHELLSRLSDFVAVRFGLHFPRKRWRDLERGISGVVKAFHFEDTESCIKWLLAGQLSISQLDTLACSLTIGETYFFRERKSFDALETRILPALIGSRRGDGKRLRIWSAGCSTGEEAYSIAMLLHKLITDLPQWNITILATDLNPFSLRKGERGEYGDWSFRGVPHRIKERYFTRNCDGRFEIAAHIRKMVTFAGLNLAEDPYPSLFNNTNAMDVIFCRNVLMYFAPQQVRKVIEGFRHSLLPGGWLVVSPCETSHTLFRDYETVSFHDAVFYRKGDRRNLLPESPVGEVKNPAISLASPETACRTTVDPSFTLRHAEPSPAQPELPNAIQSERSPMDEALALYHQGLYIDAAAELMGLLKNEEGMRDLPDFAVAATLLVRILADKGDFAAALEWSEIAVAANRLDPEIRYMQAVIFQEMGDAAAAILALRQTLYLDWNFTLAHFTLATLLLGQGKRKEAARHLDNARTLLAASGDDDILPGSEVMSARRLGEIVAETVTKAVA
jgi:chemotaxis protein methyltransferase CheR